MDDSKPKVVGILERNEIVCAKIGAISFEANLANYFLMQAVSRTLNNSQFSKELMETSGSDGGKRKIAKIVFKNLITGSDSKKMQRICDKLDKLAQKRNELVHASMAIGPNGEVNYFAKGGKAIEMDLASFNKFCLKVIEGYKSVQHELTASGYVLSGVLSEAEKQEFLDRKGAPK